MNLNQILQCYTRLPKSTRSIPRDTTAILDSGTTGNYLMLDTPCDDIRPAETPVQVQLPDGRTMNSSHTGILCLPGLPLAARRAHIFPALKDHALLSVGLLCDHGCQVHFTETDVTVFHQKVPFIIGYRASNGLWKVDLAPPATNLANAATSVVPASSSVPPCLLL